MKNLVGHPNEIEIIKALKNKRNRQDELHLAFIRLDELKNRIVKIQKTIELCDMELDWLGYERD